MIKISALNNESDEESRSDEEVSREALEQIALQQYAKALDLNRKGNLTDATRLLQDLLDTELLDEVKKPPRGEKIIGPLLNLKYLCYKNLASMLSAAGEVSTAIEAYCEATELDDRDVTLWHRLGLLCIRGKRYELALHAFRCGMERNPKHWPCLDKAITLLLGLDYKEECIATIYETLQLDPDYLRGLVYRRYIYTTYPYIRDFMEHLNPVYKWNQNDEIQIDKISADKLLNEAEEIYKTFLEQQNTEKLKNTLPNLKLMKPVRKLTWESVGESLLHMHHYISENYFSHACHIEMIFEKEKIEEQEEVCKGNKELESVESKPEEDESKLDLESDKNNESVSDNVNGNHEVVNKDKLVNDTDRGESDIEVVATETIVENQPEPKRKVPVRRRGSDLSFLQQWEWCNKRRSSGRKKTVNRQERLDDNIYDTLRRMVPMHLSPEFIQKKEDKDIATEKNTSIMEEKEQQCMIENIEYFGTEMEQKDVMLFITKYIENKSNIIDMLNDFLGILSEKWNISWPKNLSKLFVEANKCYNEHIDIPSHTADKINHDLMHYTAVNLLVEEFSINEKLSLTTDQNDQLHDLSVIESIGMILSLKPHVFDSVNILEFMLRYLWLKLHIHILNKREELSLDCLYQLLCEFEALGEHHDHYCLTFVNFTFKPILNEEEVLAYIKFLERNKKLSTVMDLYKRGNYEEVLSIVIDSFEHCRNLTRKQEDEMSLDFASQLSLILDAYWALDKVDCCFKWSLTCLHEALKHYFRYTSGSLDYEKWTLAVVKILCCMEHILTTEGMSCLETVSQKELSQGLEDLIRIIGHQVETNGAEMPFGTVVPWIIIHFIFQREEDQGRGRTSHDKDKQTCDEVPNALMVLFIAHEQLGNRGWCCASEGKLLYFILDTVVPRLRSPSLSKSLDQICQHMEQCVYCLFGHPGRKYKLKYLVDHNATSHSLDWKRAQQLYEIFRPPLLPALEGKVSAITADTEQLFHRILELLPPECNPQKYVPEIEKFIKGIEDNLPLIPPLLPYKMKDIYFLLGDFYFKKEEGKLAIKYNILDVIVNNDRLESWAEISLAKAINLERLLNSCKNLNNEREFLIPAKTVIRCFKRSLELDPTHCNMWIEYGIFVYTVHSFCSRLLKQASESLSMEDFELLEKQKEDMLDTTQKCFMAVLGDMNNSNDAEKANEDSWLQYYMLGKVAEKRNKPPSVYLGYYMQGVKSLQETDATYPLKINYNSPTNLCIEVLELHYRIHASILKYIEQHENKPIPISVGKVFATCIEEWKNGPFTKKLRKDGMADSENETKTNEPVYAANILKRSISDAGDDKTPEFKKIKQNITAAKIRRSASYDTERLANKESQIQNTSPITEIAKEVVMEEAIETTSTLAPSVERKSTPEVNKGKEICETVDKSICDKDVDVEKKEESSTSSSSSSSSDSSSSESSSNSSSESSKGSDLSTKSNDSEPLPESDIMKIVSACLDALEDCASRFPPHYKAIYRLAHYHFYYKKGKDIERCRDLMLSTFTSRAGQKLGGLFSERKPSNFFNNIWRIPSSEIDRAGGFAFHMNRSVLLTMEILKEIDDHKTLLDLSLHLQRIPEPDKKYLRDSEREELAQQAFSLCVQSLKGQLLKFSQQADLKSNDVEKQALKSLMLDIYRAYQRAQKQPNSKQFVNLLVEAYKLVSTTPINENLNLVDLSMKYCQALIQALKQQATQASLDKSHNVQKKQTAKIAEAAKHATSTTVPQNKEQKELSDATSASGLPKMSPHEMMATFQNYLPMLNTNDFSRQTAAALSLWGNLNTIAGYNPTLQQTLQTTLQNSLHNSFQAEFYRQFLGQSFSSFNVPPPKQKQRRGPKPANINGPVSANISGTSQAKPKPVNDATTPAVTKVGLPKSSSASLTPSMGKVLPSLPASMTANLSSFGAPPLSSQTYPNAHNPKPAQAHTSNSSVVNAAIHAKRPMPHQQVSSGKTLQEKLAARQKNLPSISKNSKDIDASISKLPSSLTITKTSVPRQPVVPAKKVDDKAPGNSGRTKPIVSDEVIVLDDD